MTNATVMNPNENDLEDLPDNEFKRTIIPMSNNSKRI